MEQVLRPQPVGPVLGRRQAGWRVEDRVGRGASFDVKPRLFEANVPCSVVALEGPTKKCEASTPQLTEPMLICTSRVPKSLGQVVPTGIQLGRQLSQEVGPLPAVERGLVDETHECAESWRFEQVRSGCYQVLKSRSDVASQQVVMNAGSRLRTLDAEFECRTAIMEDHGMSTVHKLILICTASALMAAASEAAVTVTQTTNPVDLGSLVSGTGITLDSATVRNGAASQFALFSGFDGSVVHLANGVVLSNGVAGETALVGQEPDTPLGVPGTAEFDAYGIGHIANFDRSFDVAALEIAFTLAAPSSVSFEFVFGSIEYPGFVGVYTDAFLAFMDGTGTENQIVFDANHAPVQVGPSFASALTTHDTSTVFSDPHGLIGPLVTTTGVLAAGKHKVLFEVGDTNDGSLDSAVFLSSLTTSTDGGTGPITSPVTPAVPEPATYPLMALGLGSVFLLARRRGHG